MSTLDYTHDYLRFLARNGWKTSSRLKAPWAELERPGIGIVRVWFSTYVRIGFERNMANSRFTGIRIPCTSFQEFYDALLRQMVVQYHEFNYHD